MDKLSIRNTLFIALFASCFVLGSEELSSNEIQKSAVNSGELSLSLDSPVQFLESAPLIDGSLDSSLSFLSSRAFSKINPHDFDGPIPDASYRLAYGIDFLYLYIEAEADSLTYRDRAYQLGDGFHMVIAKPLSDGSPTEEFYVLACSAVNNPRLEWTRRIFWYYNVHDLFVPTSDDTKLEFRDGDGVISFELLLPWRDVHPYHPWISDGIGFNLRLVKATEPDGWIRYDVLYDECIHCDLQPRRYSRLTFEQPLVLGKAQTFVLAERGHIYEGDNLALTAVAAGMAGEESVAVSVQAGEGDYVASERVTFATDSGITGHQFEIKMSHLVAGGYLVAWQSETNGTDGKYGLTILPRIDSVHILEKLDNMGRELRFSTISTLRFKLDEALAQIDSAKPYETCLQQRFRLARVMREIDKALAGTDPYLNKTGFVRRAYRSELDSSLQPYMIHVPENFELGQRYPLLVYLHGSASTEFEITNAGRVIPDGFIALAPRGRGTSNCYTYDNAQDDIAEAIAAVIDDYPIDTANIILCGFSMGGYGVYRTYYETPERFKALAVFSGHPDIANDWDPGHDYPNFTESQMLAPFKNVPMFIYHGEKDRNAPFSITRQTVGRLQRAGCQVEFHSDPDRGHENPSDEIYRAYDDWIKRVLTH
ncbi:MAG: prolyl oligopeptidase family serine peptidase [Candidatus Zixiibacteriota bacterium]